MARYDIFLSYSRADSDRVAPLRDELRRLGYRVFFDVQSIDPSSPWRQRLSSNAPVSLIFRARVGHEIAGRWPTFRCRSEPDD
jgi:hypothetical protein